MRKRRSYFEGLQISRLQTSRYIRGIQLARYRGLYVHKTRLIFRFVGADVEIESEVIRSLDLSVSTMESNNFLTLPTDVLLRYIENATNNSPTETKYDFRPAP